MAALLFWPAADILANRLSLPTPGGQTGSDMEKPESPRTPGKAQNPPASQNGAKARQEPAQGNNEPLSRQDANDNGMAEPAGAGEPSSQKRAQEGVPRPNASGQAAGAGEEGSANSLASMGEKRDDATGEPLRIPAQTESMDFLAGAWNFEYAFVGPDGSKYRQDFIFNADGRGQTILRDEKENLFVAEVMAQIDGDALRIVTGPFIDEKTGAMYSPQYIECKNGAAGVTCEGTDGFFAWTGERLLQDNSGLAYLPESRRSGKIEKDYPGSGKQGAGQRAANDSQNVSSPEQGAPSSGQGGKEASRQKQYPDSQSAKQVPEQSGQAFPQGKYAELSADGAELSPVIMEKSAKAKGDAKNISLASLAGDWRYSRDFARREDGRGLALEFHFDNAGKGYSVISDESGEAIKANAEATMTKNGHIRVKTDAYGNSFYPTFMECRPGKPDLLCDVSNGWTRMENGKLVSLNESGSKSRQDQMAEILQMPGPNEQESSARGASVADILSDFSSGETSPATSASSSTGKSHAANSSRMVLPKSGGDTKFLQGSWRCNTGLVRTSDNKPVVVEFSFDKNGQGSAIIREHSGTVYKAGAKASMQKGILRINTSMFQSHTSRSHYNKCFIECRDNGSQAICSGENGGVRWDNATFTRIK